MKIYLDVCCLNRPFDDQTQDRIRMETDSLEVVWGAVRRREHAWFSSEVVEDEILQTRDPLRRGDLLRSASEASGRLLLSPGARDQARLFNRERVGPRDSLHLAVAIEGGCQVFLTTDDDLIAKANRLNPPLAMLVINPLDWVAKGMGQ